MVTLTVLERKIVKCKFCSEICEDWHELRSHMMFAHRKVYWKRIRPYLNEVDRKLKSAITIANEGMIGHS